MDRPYLIIWFTQYHGMAWKSHSVYRDNRENAVALARVLKSAFSVPNQMVSIYRILT